MIKKLNNYEIKSFKIIIKIKSIVTILEKMPFILFFYYDFFNSSERLLFRKFLNENSLKTLMIKNEEVKQLSPILKNNKLKNLLMGNTLVLYNKNNNLIEKSIIKLLINNPKLTLIGGKWYNEIYRVKQIEKYVKLDDLTIKKTLIKELLQVSYILKNTLSRFKISA